MGFVARKGADVEEAAISIARAKQEHTVEYPSKQKNGDRPLFRLVTRVAVPCDGKPSQGATHHLTVFGFRMIPLCANRIGCAMALRYIATVKQKNGDRSSPPEENTHRRSPRFYRFSNEKSAVCNAKALYVNRQILGTTLLMRNGTLSGLSAFRLCSPLMLHYFLDG